MIRILHITKNLNFAGSSRSICAIAKSLRTIGEFQSAVASHLPAGDAEVLAREAGVRLLSAPSTDELRREIEQADIVQVEWWNNPWIYDLLRSDLPPCRLAIFVHVAGDKWPNIMIDELVRIADFVICGCRYNYGCPVIRRLSGEVRGDKVGLVFSATDFDRLAGLEPEPHGTYNVGYVGTVDFKKLHPSFVAMCAAVKVPDARFIVCGKGHVDLIQEQARALGAAGRFVFPGYVHDIRSQYRIMDVFGYPLCDSPGAELVIQDALYAGLPAVVFPLGGLRDAVIDNHNGLVVRTESEYVEALEYLYHHPDERKAMGARAAEYARRVYGGMSSARASAEIYERMMRRPKRRRRWREGASYGAAPEAMTGSARFVESLGEQAGDFILSLEGEHAPDVLAAEARIGASTPKEQFSIFEYQEHYPEDPFLHLWAGLSRLHQRDHTRAVSHFYEAKAKGIPHRRADWYLAQALAGAGCQKPVMSTSLPSEDAHHCTYYVQGKTFEEHLAWLAQAFPHVRECVDPRGMPPAVLSEFFHGLDERSRDFDGVQRNGRGDSYRKAQADPLVRSVGIRRLFELVYPVGTEDRLTPACLLLDLLGGDGTLSRAFGRLFSRQSPTIVTSDISGDMIASAIRGGLPALRQPAHHLLLRDACFHGVMCAYGTHHIPRAEMPLVAAEALRVLHPGGRVVLHDFEADSSVDRWFRDVVHPFSPTGHNFPHFERHELSHYLRGAGFRAVHEIYLYDPFLFYGSTPEEVRQKALDYLLDMYGLSKLVEGHGMSRARDLLWGMMQRYFCYDLEALDVPPGFGAPRPSLRQEQGLWCLEVPRVALVATGTK